MKRFLLFAYDIHYPAGAQGDVVGSYGSVGEAMAAFRELKRDCYDILDMQERMWVSDPRIV